MILGFNAGDNYCVMAWLANSSAPQEMSRVLGSSLGKSLEDEEEVHFISTMVSRILKHGRAIVMNTADFFDAAVVANKLLEECRTTTSKEPLMLVTVESCNKIEKENIVGILLDWLLKLPGRFPREVKELNQATSDHIVHLINLGLTSPATLALDARTEIDSKIDEVTKELGESPFDASGMELGIKGLVKLDWLIRFDAVLWKV
jgi:hypothetical protein